MRSFRGAGACALAIAVLGLANQAAALGLDLLAGGESLVSGNLTFDDFEAVATGAVSADLSLYDVSAIEGGLAISGPFAAADGDSGDLVLSFTVSTATGAISSTGLRFNGAAAGTGSSASVTETFEGVDDAQLFVFATGGGGLKLSDSLTLTPAASLRVTKDILVGSAESGGIAVISRIEQEFEVGVPEPAAVIGLGMLLVGLAFVRRGPLGV
jgi:hypothetical protein